MGFRNLYLYNKYLIFEFNVMAARGACYGSNFFGELYAISVRSNSYCWRHWFNNPILIRVIAPCHLFVLISYALAHICIYISKQNSFSSKPSYNISSSLIKYKKKKIYRDEKGWRKVELVALSLWGLVSSESTSLFAERERI